MPTSDGFRKYIEAGAVLSQITRARAEEIVRELVGSGELDRGQSQQWVDDLVERSRRASQDVVQLVRHEVRSQLAALGVDPDDLARQVADILRRTAEAGRQATDQAAGRSRGDETGRQATGGAARKAAGAKKAAAKAPTKKKAAAAKKAAAKKAGR